MSSNSSVILSYQDFINDHPDVKIIEGLGDNSQLQVYQEDADINGDLSLDTYEDIDAIYCFGNLTVTGDIENYNSEGGIGLFVAGETKANNVIAGGAVIYLNHVAVNELCVAHYNDGILEINEFSQGILISDNHSTGFTTLGVSAVAFLDYASKQKNCYLIQEFHELFQDEPWIELEYDDDEPYTYFNESDFIGLLADRKLDVKRFKSEIKQFQQQVKKNEKKYLEMETTTLKEIKGIINSKVGDMRSSGYYFDRLLYDLDISRNDSVKIIHGDTVIKEDFCIDQDQWQGISLLLIDGNFDVKGTIYNNHNKPAVKTLIIGNVQCENLVFSGEHLFINGALKVRECFYFYGNEDNENAPELFIKRRISSNITIIEYFTKLEAYFESETKLIFANTDIRKSRPINEIQKLINPDYICFDKDKHVLIESEKLIKALLSGSAFYDKETKTRLVDKLENRNALKKKQVQKWLNAYKFISSFLNKYSIQHYINSSYCSFEMKGDSFITALKETEDANSDFTVKFEYKKGRLVANVLGANFEIKDDMEKYFLGIVEKYLTDQLMKRSYYLGMFVQVIEEDESFLFNCFDGLNENERNNITSNPNKSVITSQFNLDKQELQQMLGGLALILA